MKHPEKWLVVGGTVTKDYTIEFQGSREEARRRANLLALTHLGIRYFVAPVAYSYQINAHSGPNEQIEEWAHDVPNVPLDNPNPLD